MNSPKEVKNTRKNAKVLKDKNDAAFNPPKEISQSTPKRTLSEDFSRPSKIQRSPIQRSPNPQPNRNDANYNAFNLQDVLKLSPFQHSQPLRPLAKNNHIEQGQQAQQIFLQNISQAQQQKQEQRPNNGNNNTKQKANNKQKAKQKAKRRQKQQEQLLIENTEAENFEDEETMVIETNAEPEIELEIQPIIEPTLQPTVLPMITQPITPLVQPPTQSTLQISPHSIISPMPQTIIQPIIPHSISPVLSPIIQPILQPLAQPPTQSTLQLSPHSIIPPMPQPIIQPIIPHSVSPVLSPIIQPMVSPVIPPMVQPMISPMIPQIQPTIPLETETTILQPQLIQPQSIRPLVQPKNFAKPNYLNQRLIHQNQFKIARPPWYGTRLIPASFQNIDTLHTEILQFSQYIKPNAVEVSLRQNVLERLSDVVTKIWENAQIKTFGSYETNLYLPTSDIDCSVMGQFQIPADLYTLSSAISNADLSLATHIQVIATAKVPIVKYSDKLTGIAVDISFNCNNGIENSQIVKSLINTYEVLEPLALVLKYFLSQKQLNETYTGGIGSYALVLMIVSFLEHSPEAKKGKFTKRYCDLGILLIEFFQLFGKTFNYDTTGISKEGEFFPKKENTNTGNYNQSQLTIEDPHDPENDVGRGSFRILVIKKTFEQAYDKLFYGPPPQTFYPTKLTRILESDQNLITCREHYLHTYQRLVRNKIIV